MGGWVPLERILALPLSRFQRGSRWDIAGTISRISRRCSRLAMVFPMRGLSTPTSRYAVQLFVSN